MKKKHFTKTLRFDIPGQVVNGQQDREAIDAILDSYGQLGKIENLGNIEPKGRYEVEKSYRDKEKEVARRCFTTLSDWKDPQKISTFLKETVRKTKY